MFKISRFTLLASSSASAAASSSFGLFKSTLSPLLAQSKKEAVEEDPFKDLTSDQYKRAVPGQGGGGGAGVAGEVAEERDRSKTLPLPNDFMGKQKERAKGKKKTMDDILRDVMNEAMVARDRGEKPNMDFVYKTAQEKIYEEEHGEKPPSKKSNHQRHIPFPPRDDIRRVTPFTMFDDDPWPLQPGEQKHATPSEEANIGASPNTDKIKAEEELKKVQEEDEGEVKIDRSVADAFLDTSDELAHWEKKYLEFIRDHTLPLRRALPMFHDVYKHLTHRVVRAERRYLKARDAVVSAGSASPKFFAATEKRVERIRNVYVETHKSLTQQNYEPTKMRKSFTGKIMNMNAEEFEQWCDDDRDERNSDFNNMQGGEEEEEEEEAGKKEGNKGQHN